MNQPRDGVDSIFLAALEKSTSEERIAYLDQACGDDTQLRQQVERLLHSNSRLESPATDLTQSIVAIDSPPTDASGDTAAEETVASEQPGTHIGPYKLLAKLGEGGFGVVYMAEQNHPVTRRVDMHGNLFEWCHDWIGKYPDAALDYSGPPSGQKRILRGGCWGVSTDLCRSSNRMAHDPDVGFIFMGIRLAVTLDSSEVDRLTVGNEPVE